MGTNLHLYAQKWWGEGNGDLHSSGCFKLKGAAYRGDSLFEPFSVWHFTWPGKQVSDCAQCRSNSITSSDSIPDARATWKKHRNQMFS